MKIIKFLLQFSIFYSPEQTNRQILKEFREALTKESSSQDPVTVRTYEELSDVDRIIIDRFIRNYRKSDNAVYIGRILGYSPDGIKKRITGIADKLRYNMINYDESVQKG